jgi:hypothetical protein
MWRTLVREYLRSAWNHTSAVLPEVVSLSAACSGQRQDETLTTL